MLHQSAWDSVFSRPCETQSPTQAPSTQFCLSSSENEHRLPLSNETPSITPIPAIPSIVPVNPPAAAFEEDTLQKSDLMKLTIRDAATTAGPINRANETEAETIDGLVVSLIMELNSNIARLADASSLESAGLDLSVEMISRISRIGSENAIKLAEALSVGELSLTLVLLPSTECRRLMTKLPSTVLLGYLSNLDGRIVKNFAIENKKVFEFVSRRADRADFLRHYFRDGLANCSYRLVDSLFLQFTLHIFGVSRFYLMSEHSSPADGSLANGHCSGLLDLPGELLKQIFGNAMEEEFKAVRNSTSQAAESGPCETIVQQIAKSFTTVYLTKSLPTFSLELEKLLGVRSHFSRLLRFTHISKHLNSLIWDRALVKIQVAGLINYFLNRSAYAVSFTNLSNNSRKLGE
jgi:hypothetical protein